MGKEEASQETNLHFMEPKVSSHFHKSPPLVKIH